MSSDQTIRAAPSPARPRGRRRGPLDYAWAAGAVAVATAVSALDRDALSQADIVMLHLAAIMLVAMRFGRGPSLTAAALSVLAFDFFFVPPFMTLAVADSRYLVTFGTMFAVGVLISGLTLRLRRQEAASRQREARTAALFSLSRELGAAPDTASVAATAALHAATIFDADATILAPALVADGGRDDELVTIARSASEPLEPSDLAVARWAGEYARPAGLGAEALPRARVSCFPLAGEAVMVLLPREPAHLGDSEVHHFAELVMRQVGLALERAWMSDRARAASVRAETEEMRSALLSSVSHDLRTPLAAITGAATALRDGEVVGTEVRDDLIESICDEASRLEHLVDNLLDMTRLDSGAIEPHLEWVPTDELIGAVLVRFERALGARGVAVAIDPRATYLRVDPSLFGQLLGNLVENAIKYSPADTNIEIGVEAHPWGIEIAVHDEGPGFAPGTEVKVFERFFRGEGASARGAGLGLAIALAIARAHDGDMEARTSSAGGAIVRCRLPREVGAAGPPDTPGGPTELTQHELDLHEAAS